MTDKSLSQPLLSDQDGRRPPPICAQMSGIDGSCGGTACPWTTKDAETRSEDMNKLSRAVVFCLLFMLVEVVGGIQAGSLAILTDAAHLLSDVASFAISLFAMWAGGWEANARQSYGFFRAEILGAFLSIQIIWLITGIILYEAFARLFGDPVPIDGRLMFFIAAVGLVVNLVMMFILDHGHSHGHSHGSSHGGHSHGKHAHGHSDGRHAHGHSHGLGEQHSHGHGEGQHSHSNSAVGRHHHDGDAHKDEHHHDHEKLSKIEQHEHDHGHFHHKDEHGQHGMEDERQATEDPHIEHRGKEGKLTLLSSDPIDRAALIKQDGHNTECVRENVTRSPRPSGDTIIMCICDEAEKQESSERSVRVTIDHGVDHEGDGDSPSGSSINVRGAYLHVLGDFIQSIGVMIGGAVIWWNPNWLIVDLICTFVFSALVLGTTIKMIRDILEVLMESTPREIDARALQSGLMEIVGVMAVHELHIWAITVGKVVLACHVMIDPDADSDKLLAEVIKYCNKKYKISHVTVQIERFRELERHLDS